MNKHETLNYFMQLLQATGQRPSFERIESSPNKLSGIIWMEANDWAINLEDINKGTETVSMTRRPTPHILRFADDHFVYKAIDPNRLMIYEVSTPVERIRRAGKK
jgi:hypothetical protein